MASISIDFATWSIKHAWNEGEWFGYTSLAEIED